MNCPDCKIPMEVVSHNSIGEAIEPYWKCPRCKIEVEDEE